MKDNPLTSLIERVEAAGGPDRELDVAILTTVLGYRDVFGDGILFDKGNDGYWSMDGDEKNAPLPAPTASIDAAMSLVPEGSEVIFGMRQTVWTKPWARVGPWRGDDQTAATPALALCAAALKARLTTPENN